MPRKKGEATAFAIVTPNKPVNVPLTQQVEMKVARPIKTKAWHIESLYFAYQRDPNFAHLRYNTRFSPGEGNVNPLIMFVGESPTREEELRQKMFTGPVGRVFDDMLASVDLKREHVWMTHLLKYRTPNGRDPKPGEVSIATQYLRTEINILRPRVIVPLGRFPLSVMVPNASIGDVCGIPVPAGNNRIIFPLMSLTAVTLNPVLRKPQFEAMLKMMELV